MFPLTLQATGRMVCPSWSEDRQAEEPGRAYRRGEGDHQQGDCSGGEDGGDGTGAHWVRLLSSPPRLQDDTGAGGGREDRMVWGQRTWKQRSLETGRGRLTREAVLWV